MKTAKIGKRYAKALFEFAKEKNLVEQIYLDINFITEVYKNSPDLVIALKSPIIKTEKKISILFQIFNNKINNITQKYLEIITQKGRQIELGDILYDYILLYKEFKNIKTALLYTAQKATEEFKNDIILKLSKQLNSTIELVEIIKPELLGGFIIKVDDKAIDTAISSKITKLEQEFLINIYKKGF